MTELLQLALNRARYNVFVDGRFTESTYKALQRFQARSEITPDGFTGSETWQALMPYLTGYLTHIIRRGDTLEELAALYETSVEAISIANPANRGSAPSVGQSVVIPLDFDVVPVSISFTSTILALCVRGLQARYPFIRVHSAGKSVMGRDIYVLDIGTGSHDVFYNATHHANEWITSLLLMRFLESYAKICASDGKIFDISARSLYSKTTLSLVPMINPDGADLVTGALTSGDFYNHAAALSGQYPDIPFPSGWKANISGVDLNLQYPAGWENARANKFALGVTKPGPRDFVGMAPLSEPESRAVYELTRRHNFALTLSFHTQGKTIYWKYLDYEIKNAYDLAKKFALVSGYDVEETPIMSGYAGYKDWFISEFNRPGYTIEAGEGVSPLPLSQFSQIYSDCLGILAFGLL